MAEVAADHPKVLDDLASCISFEAFDGNALTLKMCADPNDLGHDRQEISPIGCFLNS